MKKRMLILSAKEDEVPFICLARSLGYYVITTGNNPSQVGHAYANEYVPFDYSDYEGISQMAKSHSIDAVFEGCSDNCALAAAYIAEKLKLKGHDSFDASLTIHHKERFKAFCRENGIQSPLSQSFNNLDLALKLGGDAAYPLIVKPSDMAGGQGIGVAHNLSEYVVAINRAFETSKNKNVVVEPFVSGSLHSFHCFFVNKKIVACVSANDYSYKNQFMTSYGVFPSENFERAKIALIPQLEKIANLLGFSDGQLDTQYIDDGHEIWIVEMMRRCPGNHTTELVGTTIGINWNEWILRAAAGDNVSCIPPACLSERYYGYYCVMGDKNGVFDSVYIDPRLRKYIYQYYAYQSSGYVISDYLNQKIGLVEFCFPNQSIKNEFIDHLPQMIKINYR